MNFVKSTMDLSILDEVLDRFNLDENNIYETLLQSGINWENPLHICNLLVTILIQKIIILMLLIHF